MPVYHEWYRRIRPNRKPGPWEYDGEAEPLDDEISDIDADAVLDRWEFVILPEGEYPDSRSVPGWYDVGEAGS